LGYPVPNAVTIRTAVSLADAVMISKIFVARNNNNNNNNNTITTTTTNNNNNNVFYFILSPCFEYRMFSFELFSGVWCLTFQRRGADFFI
jgi:hypothetical protein